MAKRAFALMAEASAEVAEPPPKALGNLDWPAVRNVLSASMEMTGSTNAVSGGVARLTEDETTSWFGLSCLLSLPMPAVGDRRALSLATQELVTNPFLLSMRQDVPGVRAAVVRRADGGAVLVKDAVRPFGTVRFLALYNAGEVAREFKVGFRDLDLCGPVQVLDLVERADIGAFAESLSATVLPHATRFYRLDASSRLVRRHHNVR